jgi:hypothetical protein
VAKALVSASKWRASIYMILSVGVDRAGKRGRPASPHLEVAQRMPGDGDRRAAGKLPPLTNLL